MPNTSRTTHSEYCSGQGKNEYSGKGRFTFESGAYKEFTGAFLFETKHEVESFLLPEGQWSVNRVTNLENLGQ